MQIHEITAAGQLNEGLLDTIKAGLTGAKAGYRASQTNRAIDAVVNKVYPVWTAYAKRLEQSITDPTAKQAFANRSDGLYQKALTAFVQQNLLKNVRIDSAINKDQILGLIKKLSEPKGAVKPAPTAPVTTNTTQAPSSIVNPATNKPFAPVSEALNSNTEKELFKQLVQVASVAQADPDVQQTRVQAQLVSRDPAIVKFDGRTYGLDDNGEWSDIKNKQRPEQSVATYLDQVAGL